MGNNTRKIWFKKLRNKNIISLNNKPLIAHTIESAIKSKMFEKVYVLTDSIKYARIAKNFELIYHLFVQKISQDMSTDNQLYLYVKLF